MPRKLKFMKELYSILTLVILAIAIPLSILGASPDTNIVRQSITISNCTLEASMRCFNPAGSSVDLTVTFTNHGPYIVQNTSAAIDHTDYEPCVKDSENNIMPSRRSAGWILRGYDSEFKPGQGFSHTISLRSIFDLSQAQNYVVSIRWTGYLRSSNTTTAVKFPIEDLLFATIETNLNIDANGLRLARTVETNSLVMSIFLPKSGQEDMERKGNMEFPMLVTLTNRGQETYHLTGKPYNRFKYYIVRDDGLRMPLTLFGMQVNPEGKPANDAFADLPPGGHVETSVDLRRVFNLYWQRNRNYKIVIDWPIPASMPFDLVVDDIRLP